MTLLLALDPGGTPTSTRSRSATGWSLWEYDALTPLRHVAHGQVPGNQTAFKEWWWREAQGFDADEVVCESFVLDGRTEFPDVTPLRIEGMLEVLAGDAPLFFQRNFMKGHLRDERIKELGLWWEGQGHAIDSMRHAFANMKTRDHRPTMRTVWPSRRAA